MLLAPDEIKKLYSPYAYFFEWKYNAVNKAKEQISLSTITYPDVFDIPATAIHNSRRDKTITDRRSDFIYSINFFNSQDERLHR